MCVYDCATHHQGPGGLCRDYQDLLCYFKETVSWDAFALWELQGSTSREA